MNEPPTTPVADADTRTAEPPIVARAGRYFRNTRYVMFLLVLGFGVWCIHDGWVAWPRENRHVEALQLARERDDQAAIDRLSAKYGSLQMHTEMDLNIQKALGIGLPILAVLLLIRALHISRGAYRLEEEWLHVPGHPPIPLDRIVEVDRKLWDRKGILYVRYQLTDGKSGRVKLDDFVYERGPTDAIAERIQASAASAAIDA